MKITIEIEISGPESTDDIHPVCTINIPKKRKSKIPFNVQILSFIKQKGTVTRSDLGLRFGGGAIKARNAVLSTLEALGKIRSEEVINVRGPSTTMYEFVKE